MSKPLESEVSRGRLSIWQTLSRFSLVGVAATLTYLVVANMLMAFDVFRAEVASVVAYLTGMVVSFSGQSRLTFLVHTPSWGHFARFCVISAAGLLISWISVVAIEASGFAAFWATLITSVAIPALSFITMKLWVFAPTAKG